LQGGSRRNHGSTDKKISGKIENAIQHKGENIEVFTFCALGKIDLMVWQFCGYGASYCPNFCIKIV
jgi:hypothetical protein